MHGLINRSLQYFITDTAGQTVWNEIAQSVDLGFQSFEAMLSYDPAITFGVLAEASRQLNKPRHALLEDLGTYLVSHPSVEAIRRLLRFGGETYVEFLNSLHELPDRAKLAVPDLELPQIELRETGPASFELTCRSDHAEFGYVLLGVLRAMADDYGALVLLDISGADKGYSTITMTVVEAGFAEGRQFLLSGKPQEVST